MKRAGGKSWLAPTIKTIWEKHLAQFPDAALVEPFCGGCAVTFAINPEKAVLNDFDKHLINLYGHIRSGLKPGSFEADRESYFHYREVFNHSLHKVKTTVKFSTQFPKELELQAQLYYYMNRVGWRGLSRFNSKGFFNAPYGNYKRPLLEPTFSPWKEALANWTLFDVSFQELPDFSDSLVYCDPPYDSSFGDYTSDGFAWNDQIKLAEWATAQAQNNTVIISNKATKRIGDLYKSYGFKTKLIQGPRKISSDGNRKPVKEVLAVAGGIFS
jgi:DNA adenine methylase